MPAGLGLGIVLQAEPPRCLRQHRKYFHLNQFFYFLLSSLSTSTSSPHCYICHSLTPPGALLCKNAWSNSARPGLFDVRISHSSSSMSSVSPPPRAGPLEHSVSSAVAVPMLYIIYYQHLVPPSTPFPPRYYHIEVISPSFRGRP